MELVGSGELGNLLDEHLDFVALLIPDLSLIGRNEEQVLEQVVEREIVVGSEVMGGKVE